VREKDTTVEYRKKREYGREEETEQGLQEIKNLRMISEERVVALVLVLASGVWTPCFCCLCQQPD
jgi:hypothetical protein